MTATEFIGTVLAYGFFLMLGLIMLWPLLRWLNRQRKRAWQGIKYQRGRLILRPSWWLVHISYVEALQEEINQLSATLKFREENEVKRERVGRGAYQFKLEFDTPRSYNGQYYPVTDSEGNTWGIRTRDYKQQEAGKNAVVRNNKVVWVDEGYKLQKHERWAEFYDLFVLLEESKQIPLFQEN